MSISSKSVKFLYVYLKVRKFQLQLCRKSSGWILCVYFYFFGSGDNGFYDTNQSCLAWFGEWYRWGIRPADLEDNDSCVTGGESPSHHILHW